MMEERARAHYCLLGLHPLAMAVDRNLVRPVSSLSA
jgi:hypothetical protein